MVKEKNRLRYQTYSDDSKSNLENSKKKVITILNIKIKQKKEQKPGIIKKRKIKTNTVLYNMLSISGNPFFTDKVF